MDAYAPVPGKCKWWREQANEDDKFDVRLKRGDKRVTCSCFVEGHYWISKASEVPADCPNARSCRYYIKHT